MSVEAVLELAEDLDLKQLRSLIDRLEARFAGKVHEATARGDHLVNGHCSAVSWVMDTFTLSQNSASDRLRVGKQLESLPDVAEALEAGQIGYQSAAVICHLRDQLGERGDELDQEQFIGYARQLSVKGMRHLAAHTRYVMDPDGFDRDTEEDYEERFLHISEMKGMYHLTGFSTRKAALR